MGPPLDVLFLSQMNSHLKHLFPLFSSVANLLKILRIQIINA